jgi:hypothetical protein
MTALASPTAEFDPSGGGGARLAVAITLIVWFLVILSLSAAGAFVGSPGTPPWQIGLAFAAPLMLFFLWMRLSNSFRDFVLTLDLRLVAGIQAWRWAGMGFLSLYAHKVLPAVFAFPAGLGDMAIGGTAPWIVLALIRRSDFATSSTFIRWNVLGIVDLLIAVSIGTADAFFATGAPGEISTATMASLPLTLIPAFLVPLFLMLHATALLQGQRLGRTRT